MPKETVRRKPTGFNPWVFPCAGPTACQPRPYTLFPFSPKLPLTNGRLPKPTALRGLGTNQIAAGPRPVPASICFSHAHAKPWSWNATRPPCIVVRSDSTLKHASRNSAMYPVSWLQKLASKWFPGNRSLRRKRREIPRRFQLGSGTARGPACANRECLHVWKCYSRLASRRVDLKRLMSP